MQRSLFVPLKRTVYDLYSKGRKWELRRVGGPWNESQLLYGRRVTLVCGYSNLTKSGIIGKILFGTLDELLCQIPLPEIIPCCHDLDTAKNTIRNILCGHNNDFVAFEICDLGQ